MTSHASRSPASQQPANRPATGAPEPSEVIEKAEEISQARALRTWVVTDGKIGMVNQCLGLAGALGVTPEQKTIELARPWRWLPPVLTPSSLSVLARGSDPLTPPWPDLLIASGRKSVPVSRAVRRASGGATFTVQIQDPAVAPDAFDLVVAPEHDGLHGPAVLSALGSMHGITARTLGDARARFASRVADLPRPLVAVLLGGDNAVYRMSEACADRLIGQLRALATQGYGLAVTASRRTPDAVVAQLERDLDLPGVDIWDGTGPNPYLGFLAAADAVIVTGDSVNMVSEAAATGKPVHVVHLDGGSEKFTRFHDAMAARGITRTFDGVIASWTYALPDDTARAAAEIRRRIDRRIDRQQG